jgi:hypothetical protein
MTTNKVTHARPEPQEVVHSASMKLSTVTALFQAWLDKDRAGASMDNSHLLAPLDVLREAETELLNIEWTRIRVDGGRA